MKHYPVQSCALLVTLLSSMAIPSICVVGAEDDRFQRDVAPILQSRCLSCHNERDRRGGLSLQSRHSLLQGGESGAVVVPGDVDSSYLLDLLVPVDGEAEMPKGEAPLDPSEIETVRRWIQSGANWPESLVLEPPVLWSLKPIEQPSPPAIDTSTSNVFPIRNPIDAFVAARHREAKLKSAAQAERHTLIRRLYLDLTGLPPTPEVVQAFVESESPDAYEDLVDDLLASPHYGEHWGRHWLDLARYADSEGYLGDSERPHAWIYREWVIHAINNDLPFDQFTIEQLAGDLLPNSTLEQKIATGFHRNTLRNTEAGVDLELYRTKEIIDRVNTTGMVWLGLTFGCAECHDHKNDPITQQEFYQLYAFFNNADEVGVTATQPWQIDEFDAAMQPWQARWDELLKQLKPFENENLSDSQKAEITATFDKYLKPADLNGIEPFYRTTEPSWKELRTELETHLAKKPSRPSTKARAFAERRKDRRETFVHIRGVYNRPGAKVELAVPAVLPPLQPRGAEPDRLDLARWLFDEENPLTARVAVNRIWQQLFGQGIVSTTNDFGNEGAEPTHPLLLDWLATEFRRLGWSQKALIRRIVLSSTYRLSSAANAVPNQDDDGNLLLWRQNSYRVNAETVRDLHLAASGLLDRTVGRQGIRPPLPEFVTEVGRSVKWPVSQGSEQYRRGMYIFFKRTVPYPMLMTFDAPDATASCSRRERSNTPLQALTLLNDPVFYECAQALARRATEASSDNPTAAIRMIFSRCLGRFPNPRELAYLTTAHTDLVALKMSEANTATEANDNNDDPQLAAMTAVARIVMNLDEFVTRD
ncbi:MAG: PSD1 domain-containing protein [Planctomycetales bacterium]|nr:PSD1 domain-containing protein [Planctomycetales bacterium]